MIKSLSYFNRNYMYLRRFCVAQFKTRSIVYVYKLSKKAPPPSPPLPKKLSQNTKANSATYLKII